MTRRCTTTSPRDLEVCRWRCGRRNGGGLESDGVIPTAIIILDHNYIIYYNIIIAGIRLITAIISYYNIPTAIQQ